MTDIDGLVSDSENAMRYKKIKKYFWVPACTDTTFHAGYICSLRGSSSLPSKGANLDEVIDSYRFDEDAYKKD